MNSAPVKQKVCQNLAKFNLKITCKTFVNKRDFFLLLLSVK